MVTQQLTSFIGRTHELAEIAALLADPACRLLTLVGPGGIGKTRLALEVVNPSPLHGEGLERHTPPLSISQAQGEGPGEGFLNGVHFVPLQPISDAALLPIAIANAIGIQFFGADEPRVQLLNYLQNRQTLLILDNFEHLLDGVDFVGEILSVSGVKLLVTSRTALNVQAEWRYAVGGLCVPESKPLAQGERGWGEGFEDSDAVKLFCERARRLRHDFSLDSNRADVIRICQLTEGMPLALELAAGWLKALSCAEIANEIQRGLDFLAADVRDVPERHRSMAAAFAQSWHFLTEDEQKIFRRMSVFRGGFTREAAENVTGTTLQTLASLVDKSLLRASSAGRYDVHELMRQYGAGKLEAAGEVVTISDAHSEYYLGLLQSHEAEMKGPRLVDALNTIERDFDNVRIAWHWAVANRSFDRLDRAMAGLFLYGTIRAGFVERGALFRHARDQLSPLPGQPPHPVWNRLSVRCYSIHEGIRQPAAEARPAIERALAHARETGRTSEIAFCLHALGHVIADLERDYETGLALYNESLSLYEMLGDVFYCVELSFHICAGWHYLGQPQRCPPDHFRRAAALARNAGIDCHQQAMWAFAEAYIAYDYAEAEVLYRDSIRLQHKMGNWRGISLDSTWLALLLFLKGDFDEAELLITEAQQVAEHFNDPDITGWSLTMQGVLENMRENYALGKHLCQQGRKMLIGVRERQFIAYWGEIVADYGLKNDQNVIEQMPNLLKKALEITSVPMLAQVLTLCAFLLNQSGQKLWAAQVLAITSTHPNNLAGWIEKWPMVARLRTDLETELGTEAFTAAWERGTHLDIQQTASEVLRTFAAKVNNHTGQAHQNVIDSLTPRELEVLRLLAAGLSNVQIAERLVISVGTAKTHVHNILGKLGVESRAQAIARIREFGLI